MNKQNKNILLKLVEVILNSDNNNENTEVFGNGRLDESESGAGFGDGHLDGHGQLDSCKPVNKGRYIVIGNRGNIVVGDLVINGDFGYMSNASVIRRWGTSKGLGQLALEGKQSETVLDECGGFEFHIQTTCGMIKVESDL